MGVVVGIDDSNWEDVDPSVNLIDGSDEVVTGFGPLVTGSNDVPVTSSLDDLEEVSLVLLVTDELSVFEDENLVDVGSAVVSAIPVVPVKLSDGESVTYGVEKELLTVLVAVVGVAEGMDDKTEEDEVPSLSPPFCPSPPSTIFLVLASDGSDDDLSTEDNNVELLTLDLNDDVVYLRLVVDSENFVSVTAMVVPVDLPGEKVMVLGIVGLLDVEGTNSDVTEEVTTSEDLPDDSDDMDDEVS